MAYASVGTFTILVLMELATYPWRHRTRAGPELKEVYDVDDIQHSELLELQDFARDM